MKTLVTVPPVYTERVKTVNPTRFFLQVVGKSLLEVLFDQDATITDEVSVTLQNLLKSLDIDEIPGMCRNNIFYIIFIIALILI